MAAAEGSLMIIVCFQRLNYGTTPNGSGDK